MEENKKNDEKKFEYKKCKRLMEDIQKAYLEYGKNRIFLIGDELKDLYLRDIRDGYFDLTESIKDYTLHNDNFKWFIYLSGAKNGKYFEKVKDKKGNVKFLQVEHTDFKPQEVDDPFGLMEHENKIEDTEEANVNIDKADVIDEVIDFLFNGDCNSNEEVCLFIEDLDWAAKFYNEGTDGKDSKFIKQIKDLEKLKKHLVIISIKDKTVFEETYYEKLDDKELITVPKATTEEIEMTLYRLTWKAIKKNLKNIAMNDLALAFSNSKTSLREVIRVFNKKIKTYGQNLKIENFEFKEKVKEKIYWKDVEIDQETKDELIKKIRAFKDGESKEKGILLYGPPGTGKTMVAKAMATEEKLYFLAPKLSELKGEYVGQSAPKVKALFEEARANEPTLIFLDEVDTLFPARDHGDGDSYTKDMVNEFLQQLDGVDTGEQKIIVLAATNREYMIDPAVKSRLGDSIEIPLPLEEQIKKMYNNQFKDEFEDDFINILSQKNRDELIRKSTGMSGRDIKNICENMKKKVRYQNFRLETDSNKRNEYFKDILNDVFKEKMNNIINNMNNNGLEVYLEISNVNNLYGQDVDKIKKELKYYIKEITETTKQRQDREAKNIKKQNGILLYGPPGNGKTELVKNICKENNLIFIGANGKSFVGNTERNTIDMIENIFEDTYRLSNICPDEQAVVLFFDEFDSLVGPAMSSTTRGTVLTKLSEDKRKDGIRHNASKILLVGATNFYDDIDEAVKRPGRFDGHFALRNPRKVDAIKIILETFNHENMVADDQNIIESFYEIIRSEDSEGIDAFKNLSSDRYEIDDSEVQRMMNLYLNGNKEEKEVALQFFRECEKKYLCSGSSIKTHILKLKRFLYNEGYFEGDKFEVTEDLLNKYKER